MERAKSAPQTAVNGEADLRCDVCGAPAFKSDARSSAADAATRGTAPTPEFRQVTRPSADDVIINGKSFSAPGLSARNTGEANGFPNTADRVRPEGPLRPDGGA